MSETSRAETLIETGQASYFDVGGLSGEQKPRVPSSPPRRSPRGVSYREPSDSDLDPYMAESITPVSIEQRLINRAGIDGVMKALEDAELARATTEDERNLIREEWEVKRQKRAEMRERQDRGERIILP